MILDIIALKKLDVSDPDRIYADFKAVFDNESPAAMRVLAYLLDQTGWWHQKVPEKLEGHQLHGIAARAEIGQTIVNILAHPPEVKEAKELPSDDG